MRTLCFQGMGWPEADVSKATVGNCRIRTAFHLDNGRPVFLEIEGNERPAKKKNRPACYEWQYTGFVDFCFYITDDEPNDDENLHRLLMHGGEKAEREAEELLRKHTRAEHKTPEQWKEEYDQILKICDNMVERNTHFEYSKEGILGFLKSIGATFDDIRVLNEGYDTFNEQYTPHTGGCKNYNFGDEYVIQFRR